MAVKQVISAISSNPNTDNIFPQDRQDTIVFVGADATNLFLWSVPSQIWLEYLPAQLQQVDGGTVDPTLAPPYPAKVAYYENFTTGVTWVWNPATQAWA